MDGFGEVVRAAARLATGGLGWTPSTFWDATPADLRLALEGRLGGGVDPLGTADLARLRERLSDG